MTNHSPTNNILSCAFRGERKQKEKEIFLWYYEPFAEWAGAGATVPLTGFGYAMAKGTEQAISDGGVRGILTGAFTSASGGVTAAILCGLIASFITRPKEK